MIILRQSCGHYTIDKVRDCRPSLVAARLRFIGRNDLVCGEIGVHRGANALRIRSILKPARLYLFDIWKNVDKPEKGETAYLNSEDDLREATVSVGSDKMSVLVQCDSTIALPKLPDDLFDYLYIDGDHSEKTCAQDIINGLRVTKVGGILGGHDYGIASPPGCVVKPIRDKRGVDLAVGEVFDGIYVFSELSDWWVIVTPEIKEQGRSLVNSNEWNL